MAMTTISLKVPAGLKERLNAAAARRGTSKSSLVREALDAYLVEAQELRPGSVAQRWGDAVGSLEGPGDLSSNPDHLQATASTFGWTPVAP